MIFLKFKSFLLLFFAVSLTVFFFAFAFSAHARENPFGNIEFPISELSDCGSFEECRTYCEEPANYDACGAWAEKSGLIEDKASEAPEIDDDLGGKSGPGGCKGREECGVFCQNPSNQVECINFAVQEGFMSEGDASRILTLLSKEEPGIQRPDKFSPQAGRRGGPVGPGRPQIDEEKARQALEEFGGGPGGCQDLKECDAFCSTAGNENICFDFAIEHGFMDPAEAEKFKKLIDTEGPGGCRGRECEVYCEAPGHEKECLAFAHENGFIGDEEFQEAQRFVSVIDEKGGPGGCRGRECEKFCNDQANRDTCFEFAKNNNLLPPQELERIEKFKVIGRKVEEQGGPGGCRGETECRTYCSDISHFDECAAFAVNEGFLAPDEAEQSLRQFVEVEQFGPPGRPGKFFGPGGPGGSGGPQGFRPGGEGGFPPGFDQIPPEFRAQAEEQFKSRFQQFEQFRGQFERGEIPIRNPEVFGEHDGPDNKFGPGGPEEPRGFGPGGAGDFPPPQEFSKQFEQRRGEFSGPDEFPTPDKFPGKPPSGGNFPPQPGQFIQEFRKGDFPQQFEGEFKQQFDGEVNRQFEHEIQNQFNQEFQRQFEQQSGGFVPPPGSFSPQPGNFIPSGDNFSRPQEGNINQPINNFQPPTESFIPSSPSSGFDGGTGGTGSFAPPTGDFSQPPSPPPTSFLNLTQFFTNVFSAFNPTSR